MRHSGTEPWHKTRSACTLWPTWWSAFTFCCSHTSLKEMYQPGISVLIHSLQPRGFGCCVTILLCAIALSVFFGIGWVSKCHAEELSMILAFWGLLIISYVVIFLFNQNTFFWCLWFCQQVCCLECFHLHYFIWQFTTIIYRMNAFLL